MQKPHDLKDPEESQPPKEGIKAKWGNVEVEGRGRDIIFVLCIIILGLLGWIHHDMTVTGFKEILETHKGMIRAMDEANRIQRDSESGIIFILSRTPEERAKLNLQEPESVRRLRIYNYDPDRR